MGTPTPAADLPDGYAARGLLPEDFDAVLALIRADEAATRGEADLSAADLRSDVARPGFDPATQACVVVHEGEAVAYAEQVHGRSYIHVTPAHHGQGLGGALLDWAEARAVVEGQPHIGQTVFDANSAAVALHCDRGYQVRWETWVLERDLDDLREAGDGPQAPAGFRFRDLDKSRDAREVSRVITIAFDTWGDRDPVPFEDWKASFFDRDDVTPADSHLLETDDGVLVGVLLGLIEGDEGIVEQLAVDPAYFRRGLGKLLLQRSFARFAAAGLRQVVLSTESRTNALPFYEAAGMHITKSFTRYHKPLTTR